MKIHFDVTCLMPKRISGIGVYARELYGALKAEKVDIEPVTKLSRIFKPSAVLDHIKEKERTFWGPLEALKGTSIIQGPDFRLLSNSTKFFKIVTIHDLAVFHKDFNEEAFRHHGQRKTKEVLYKGQPDVIVADTEIIAEEIREFFPDFASRVVCIPPGSDHLLKHQKSIDRPSKKSPYFLFAGHLETRKNVLGVVKAFEILERKHVGIRLVLVGKDGYQGEEIRKYISTSSAKKAIDVKGYVDETELRALYTHATAFVFPSYYEGFGFPILEAMSLGCPVITSNGGAMGEVAGTAALLVDPNEVEEISHAMERLLEDSKLARKLMDLGEYRFRDYSWKKCADGFLKLYKSHTPLI